MTVEELTKLITHLRAMGVRSFKDPTSGLEVTFDREGPVEKSLSLPPDVRRPVMQTAAATWGTWGPEPEKA